jgi:adenylate cyclase
MTPEKFKRKLTAILSADVKGYSRLMGVDEEATVRTLQAYKEVMASSIQHHRGRIVDAPGDNILAEFASVVDAVQCGVEIQQVLRAKNALLPETRRMDFRIGINLGDVIEEGDSIYGDGVNIAARLESLAEAGGICISGSAYEQIENKLPLRYDYLGEHEVKNIAKPVRVYRAQIESGAAPAQVREEKKPERKRFSISVLAGVVLIVIVAAVAIWQLYLRSTRPPVEIASKEKMAFPLPDKPSIAVLAFVNMSDDPKQEYLADGLAEEIINGLSKCPYIFVIARNSSFTYKGKPVKVQQVAEELGVRNVLEGSLRKTGDKVRITVQLIDALTGQHLLSERYDRELKDILVMQDEITMKILGAVQVKLTAGEDARLRAKGTKNLEAYLKLMQAGQYMRSLNKENCAFARQLAEEAIVLDPKYPAAYATLCFVQLGEVVLGVYKNPREALERGVELGKKSITLDDSSPYAHANLARTYSFLKEHDKAISEAEKAVSLAPNSAHAYNALGFVLEFAGRHQEAISFFKKCLRLSPIPIDPTTLGLLGFAYRHVGQYEEAVASCKKALQLYGGDHLLAHLVLAGAYALMGREKEAHAEAAEVLRIDPKFSLESYARRLPYTDQKTIDDIVSALRKAGLK